MKVIVMRCLIESCRKVFSVEKDEETEHENFNCPICNDGYFVTKFGEGEIVFEGLPQAIKTTEQPSKAAAVEGILTEEELNKQKAKLIAFDCIKCFKTLQMDEATYEENYKGNTECLTCQTIKGASPKRILSANELNQLENFAASADGLDETNSYKVIDSHRAIQERKRNLVLENDEQTAEIMMLKEFQKNSDEIIGDYVEKAEQQNEEISRLQDEISRLKGENIHE